MSFKFGKYHAVKYQRRTITPSSPTKTQLDIINHRLNDLTDLLQDCPVDWFLVGGLGTALTYGEITRNHGDVDIQVFTRDAYQLMDYMSQKGYFLFQKK
jgi:hypothetical protein